MKAHKYILSIIIPIILFMNSQLQGQGKKEYVIIDKTASARLLSCPLDGNVLCRIPAGTKVQIFKKQQARSGMLTQTWYLVKYNRFEGWISQYVTMGDIITYYEQTGKTEINRAPNANKPKLVTFDKQAKQDFKKWVLKNTEVTWFEYKDDGIIWIKLTRDKYTTKSNVKKIAESIARYYKMQTQYKKPVVVTIWDLYENKIWAKGHHK